MCVIEAAHLPRVEVEALEELLLIGQESPAVAVRWGVADGEEPVFQVEVLDAQTQASAVEEAGDEVGCAIQVSEDAQAFSVAEVRLDAEISFSAEGVQIAKGDTEDCLVEEPKGREGLVLG